MSVYSKKLLICCADCDINLRLKASRLFTFFQDIAGEHCEEFGLGQRSLMARGLGWIIVRQHLSIYKTPVYEDKIILETYTGKPRFAIQPRYYTVRSNNGELLAESQAWWAVLNYSDRALADNIKENIIIPRDCDLPEMKMPPKPHIYETVEKADFFVPWSYCDINGHMNNAAYIDICEDRVRQQHTGKRLCDLNIEYTSEVRTDDKLLLEIGRKESAFSVHGVSGKAVFTAELKYE